MFIRIILSAMLFVLSFATNVFALGDISFGTRSLPLRINGIDNMLVNGVKDSDGDKHLIALGLGAEYFHDVKGGFKIGMRYEDTNTGRVKLKNRLEIETNLKDVDGYCEASLKSVMLGGSYNESISEKANWNSKLFFGYGRAELKSEFYLKESKKTIDSKKINEKANCFIVAFSVGVEYFFTKTKRFGIGFDLGYAYAPKVVLSKNVELTSSGMMSAFSLIYKL